MTISVPYLRLGVNIDHVATVRNARGGAHPDPVRAALLAVQAGADGITAHLREDRRHITDADIAALKAQLTVPLNLEMAATEEMLAIATHAKPHAACIVPEKRQELTTEGGLDVAAHQANISKFVKALQSHGIRVSLFIDPDARQVDAAKATGCDIVEFHTGKYCEMLASSSCFSPPFLPLPLQGEGSSGETAAGGGALHELHAIQAAVRQAHGLGLECHAGHGLGFETVGPIAAIPEIVELNIGHFLIGEAIFGGLESAIRRMREQMNKGRGTR